MAIREIAILLINPLLYVFAGLLFLLMSRRYRKGLLATVTVFLYLIAIPHTAHLFNDAWKVRDTFHPDQTYDAVVVLAGIADAEWYLDDNDVKYKAKNHYRFNRKADRLLAGIGFVKSGQARMLLIGEVIVESYDKKRLFNETELIKSFALQQGLEEEDIVIYGRVDRTVDEAKGVKAYADNHSLKKLLLITSEMHMRRGEALFSKVGLQPDLYSVNTLVNRTRRKDFAPSPHGISLNTNCLYELTAFVGHYLKGDL